MLEISLGDCFLGFDRVHEAQHCFRKRVVDKADFADRGDVIMCNAGIPEDAEEVRRRVRLHRIERAARKLLDEVTGGATRSVRT